MNDGDCYGLHFVPIGQREGVYERNQYSRFRESKVCKKRLSIPEASCLFRLRLGWCFTEWRRTTKSQGNVFVGKRSNPRW